MGKTFADLRNGIRNAIRVEVATIPDFEEGAIMLCFVVKSKSANIVLGCPCDDGELNADVIYAYSARPNSPKTRKNGFRGMTDGEVACLGYAALKNEGCCYAVRNNLGHRSSDMPDEAVTWGRVNDRGTVCFDVIYNGPTPIGYPNKYLFLRIYITVSGASGEEDERCALAAAPVIKEWAAEMSKGLLAAAYSVIEPE